MKKTIIAMIACIIALAGVGYITVEKIKGDGPTIEKESENISLEQTVFTAENTQSFKVDEFDASSTAAESTSESEKTSAAGNQETDETTTCIEGPTSYIIPVTEHPVTKQTTEKTKPDSTADKTTSKENKTTSQAATTQATTAKVSSTYAYAYAGFNPKLANTSVPVEKILVNRDYILPENYSPSLAPSVTSIPDSKKLDSRVAPHYNEMYLAAKKDGITLTPLSGYRSYSLQKNNYENKINVYKNQGYDKVAAAQKAATIILPPGTSEHNAGLAMDICSLEQSFENSKEFAWLQAHAADYGFILRYPKNKENVTKIIYEPWHWRYVGVETAKEIKSSGMCLEEYLGKV